MKNTKQQQANASCTKQGSLDGGLSWLIVISSFLQQVIVMGTHNVFGLFYTDLLKEFKQDRATTAWVGSLSFGATFLLGPLSTVYSAKCGVRIVSLTGALLFPVGLLSSSIVTSLGQLYFTYSLVFAIGSCFSYYSSILILSEYFRKRLVTTNGIALSGAGVGTLALAPAVGSLLEIFDWRSTLRILSAISSVQVLCSCIQYLVKPPDGVKPLDTDEKKSKSSTLIDFSLLKNKAYVVWIFVVSLVLFGFYVPYVHLVQHGKDLDISIEKGAILVGYLAISQTIGKIVFGRISDHPRINRVYLYQYCLLVCSISTTLLPLMKTIEPLAVYCWVFGFHDGCFVVLLAVLSGDIAGEKNMSAAFSLMYLISGIPMMLGPPVAGWIYSSTGTYVPAFFMAGGFTSLGVCLLFLIPFLLPPEISREWVRRSSHQCESKHRSISTTTTNTLVFSDDGVDEKKIKADQSSSSASQEQNSNLTIKKSKETNRFRPHPMNQKNTLFCTVDLKEDFYGISPPPSTGIVRETDV